MNTHNLILLIAWAFFGSECWLLLRWLIISMSFIQKTLNLSGESNMLIYILYWYRTKPNANSVGRPKSKFSPICWWIISCNRKIRKFNSIISTTQILITITKEVRPRFWYWLVQRLCYDWQKIAARRKNTINVVGWVK